jgi:hypothetical protein
MDTQNVTAGQSFAVPINFGTNEAVRLIAFDITYDPAVVRVDAVSEGPFMSSFAQTHGGATNFYPGAIHNDSGRVNGVGVSLRGADGSGAIGAGVVAVIHFTALNVHNKSTTGLVNDHILDTTGSDLAPYTMVTGGLVQVGPGPLIGIASLKATPSGLGADAGKTFKVQFTISNIDGITSDPATATIAVNGATPTYQQLPIPPIDPDHSVTIEVPSEFHMAGQVKVGDVAEITLAVSSDGNRTITYTYQPVMDIKNTDVDANVVPFIQLSAPAQVGWPTLELGANQMDASLTVLCNTGYQVSVMDSNPTIWRMTEWDGSSFLTRKMLDPLHVVSIQQGRDVSAGTPSTLITGSVADQSMDAGREYALSFRQMRHTGDAALTGGKSYHLIVTFTGFILF